MTIAANLKIEENPFARELGVKEWLKRQLQQPSPEEYLIEELIPAKALVSVQTSAVFGKTTLATQLAMSVAFGLPFLGRYKCIQPGKVLFINARDTDEDSHRRFKRLVREWSSMAPEMSQCIDENLDNFTHISLFDECFGVTPHLVDVSGSMTKTYAYLHQFGEYFKCKLIVLDPIEDFFPENLKNISELYLKLRQLPSSVLLVAGSSRNEAFHKVEVGMSIVENGLRIHSDYLGCRDIGMAMGAGIWFPT
ncbi:MAG TPA: AAA family ATPase [Desulfuromonadales bacterium]|nr:AAA family ATPase [Desulfuromonadales bacterium]